MKWFIVFLAIACGQHREPAFQDLRDFDGDQILNYQEDGDEKIFANFESIGEVKGVLRFLSGDLHEVPFTNSIDKKKLITHLLLANEEYLKETPFFSEWMYLNLKSDSPVTLKAKQYSVHLSFESTADLLEEVAIVSGKDREVLGPWSGYMKLELSSQVLQDLLSGKKILAVRKKMKKSPLFQNETEETIKNKTARLYLDDGKSPLISYVSNKMSLKDVLEVFKIKKSNPVDEQNLIFNLASDESQWFHRELKNGDIVLIRSSESELKKEILKNFEYTKTLITRENGFQAKITSLSNKKGAKIHLRISDLTRSDRKFRDYIVTKVHGRYGSARNGDWSPGDKCDHYLREIVEETTTYLDKEELMEHLTLSPSRAGKSLLPEEKLEEKYGENGAFWEASLMAEEDNLIVSLESLPLHTFSFTGEFKNSCRDELLRDGRFASFSTHPEGKLSFILESYVEKIP